MSMAAMLGAARGGRFSISDRSRQVFGDDRVVAEVRVSVRRVGLGVGEGEARRRDAGEAGEARRGGAWG